MICYYGIKFIFLCHKIKTVMTTFKDHSIILFISLLVILLVFDNDKNFLGDYGYHAVLNISLGIVCILFTNKKLFSLTINKLNKFERYEKIEYKLLYHNNLVTRIYARPYSSSYWYELYYPLTIDRNLTYNEVNEFLQCHSQVSSLRRIMRQNGYKKDDIDWVRFIIILFYWLFEIYYWLVLIAPYIEN